MQLKERARVKRGVRRAVYERDRIYQILDDNLVCHVGFVDAGEARVIPTAFLRQEDTVILHGNRQNGMMNALLDGQTACISVLQLDGIVLARSGFHSSVNYRSVVLFGKAEPVGDDDKRPLLNAFLDKLAVGRAADIRPHSAQELDATLVVRIPIDEASAKVRSGPPVDDEADYDLDIWSGVLALRTSSEIQPCPRLANEAKTPAYLATPRLWPRQ